MNRSRRLHLDLTETAEKTDLLDTSDDYASIARPWSAKLVARGLTAICNVNASTQCPKSYFLPSMVYNYA